MLPETVPALLALRALQTPDKDFVVSPLGCITYGEIEQRSAQRAAWLVAHGVNKTHRLGLMMENGVEWAINAMAALKIGAVLVPLSTLLKPVELHSQLALAGVRHLIATAEFRGRDYRAEMASLAREEMPNLQHIWWAEELGDNISGPANDVAQALAAQARPADDMAIVFTSGSRSLPRGIIHTHGGALRAVASGLAARCIKPDTRLYIPMPLFWVGGLSQGLLSALSAGATLLTEAQAEPAATLAFLEAEKVTLFRGWPDQAAALVRHPGFAQADLGSLTAGSLDAVLPAGLQARPGARSGAFGMTESFGTYAAFPLDTDMPHAKWGSCGKPLAGMKVRIADPDTGAGLAPGETGSIQLGGRNILRGICGREREEVFTPDGWYDTGDMGRLDADGFLWFAGRRDDMVKISGATVYPCEVEVALQAIAGVARAFATDLVVDGKPAIGAAVLPASGVTLDEATLALLAKERLSAFKIPSRWKILGAIDEVPRNASDKVDKAGLQALILG